MLRAFFFASFVFCVIWGIWFTPLFQGQEYGLEQRLVTRALYPEQLTDDRQRFPKDHVSRYKLNINMDYHLLLLPTQKAISQALQQNEWPIFDFNRLMGVKLLGNPIVDLFNPLNVWLKDYPAKHIIIIKSSLYMLLGFLGAFFLMAQLGAGFWPSVCVALFFIFSSNSMHYLHWSQYLGVAACFPWMLLGLTQIYNKRYFSGMLFFGGAIGVVLLLNMAELLFYEGLLVLVLFVSCVLLNHKQERGRIILATVSAVMGGLMIGLPQLAIAMEYMAEIARQPEPFWNLWRQPYLPAHVSGYWGVLGWPVDPVKNGQHYPFFSLTFLILFVVGLVRAIKSKEPLWRALAVTAGFLFLFLFVGGIDLPVRLFWPARLFVNPYRMLHFVYLLFGLFLIWSWNFKLSLRWVLALIASQTIILFLAYYFLMIQSPDGFIQNVSKNPIFVAAMILTCLQGLAFWRGLPVSSFLSNGLKVVTLVGPIILVGKGFMPYDQPASENRFTADLTCHQGDSRQWPTKCMLIDGRVLTESPLSHRLYSGAPITILDKVSIGGYETGMRKTDNWTFVNLWNTPAYSILNEQRQYSWMKLQDYWFVPDPERFSHQKFISEGIVEKWLQAAGVSEVIYQQDATLSNSHEVFPVRESAPISVWKNCSKSEILGFLNFEYEPCGKRYPLDAHALKKRKYGWSLNLPEGSRWLVIPFNFANTFVARSSLGELPDQANESAWTVYDVTGVSHVDISSEYLVDRFSWLVVISFAGFIFLLLVGFSLRKVGGLESKR